MRENDFTKPIKTKLRERVGNRCSNPNCNIVTTGPKEGSDGILTLGDAAHICAASPGGPRFDNSLTNDQIRSINNGIWLCTACARKIDQDQITYPVETLTSWKEQAEKNASAQVGKPAISSQTVKQEVAAMMTAVPTLSSTLIPNAHASVNSAIEQLDHRFTVKTSFDGDQTTYTMLAKENVEFQFKFQTDGKNEIGEKLNSFLQEAEDFSVDASKVSISGSPILTYALEDSKKSGTGALMFQAPKHDAILKLSLESSKGHQRFDADDVHGKIQVGHSAATFTGELFGGSINIRLRITNRGQPGRVTFDFHFIFRLVVDRHAS